MRLELCISKGAFSHRHQSNYDWQRCRMMSFNLKLFLLRVSLAACRACDEFVGNLLLRWESMQRNFKLIASAVGAHSL